MLYVCDLCRLETSLLNTEFRDCRSQKHIAIDFSPLLANSTAYTKRGVRNCSLRLPGVKKFLHEVLFSPHLVLSIIVCKKSGIYQKKPFEKSPEMSFMNAERYKLFIDLAFHLYTSLQSVNYM